MKMHFKSDVQYRHLLNMRWRHRICSFWQFNGVVTHLHRLTDGSMVRAVVIGLWLTTSAGLASANSGDHENVMRALANVKSAVVDFVEVRESGFLTSQLIVKGQMSYESPGTLRRTVLEPFAEEILIEGDTVTLTREQDTTEGDARIVTQRVSLESAPVVRSIVESVRSTFAGDLSRLSQLFDIEWQGSDENWTMRLVPTDERLQKTITSIQLTGNMSKVATITTVESDGDESVMTLTYLDTP